MKKLAVDKTLIVLETEHPWSWESGRKLEIAIDASDAPLKVGGAPALAVRDVIDTIEKEISGRKYTYFMGSKPGTVSALGVRADEASLLRHLVLGGGRRLISSETKGEFAVSVSNRSTLRSTTPPTPDPLPMHFGKWWVENPKQQVCIEGGSDSVSTPAAPGSPTRSSTRPPSAAGKREGKSEEEDGKPEEERKPRRLVFTVAMDDGAGLQCVDIDARRLGLCFDPPPDSATEAGRLPWEGRKPHDVMSMEEKLRNACRDWRPEAESATEVLPSGGAAAAESAGISTIGRSQPEQKTKERTIENILKEESTRHSVRKIVADIWELIDSLAKDTNSREGLLKSQLDTEMENLSRKKKDAKALKAALGENHKKWWDTKEEIKRLKRTHSMTTKDELKRFARIKKLTIFKKQLETSRTGLRRVSEIAEKM